MQKNDAKISGFAVAKKISSKKNFFHLICADVIFKMLCGIFFEIMGLEIFKFSVILRFRKIVLHNKSINKSLSTKNFKNSAHRFGDNYLTNHLVKSLQDRIKPWRVAALRVCTGYDFFFRKNRQWGVSNLL